MTDKKKKRPVISSLVEAVRPARPGPLASTPSQRGLYGTQGIASPSNTPGARVLAISWIDAAGNLWLFGGDGFDSIGQLGQLNDLWKYSGGQWTWVGGSNIIGRQGTYGTLATPAQTNIPGSRTQGPGWVDGSGHLWLFGGDGYDGNGTLGYLDDLWRYQQ